MALDIAEGADMVMVKPGIAYLDIISACQILSVPCIAYGLWRVCNAQAAVQAGWLDKQTVVFESMMAFKRAGPAEF